MAEDDDPVEARLERPRGQRLAAAVVVALLAAAALAAWLA